MDREAEYIVTLADHSFLLRMRASLSYGSAEAQQGQSAANTRKAGLRATIKAAHT